DDDLANAAYTLQTGRAALKHRLAVVCREGTHAVHALSADASQRRIAGVAEAPKTDVVFMFSGQCGQHPGMARALYEGEPVFRAAIDVCAAHLQRFHGGDIRPLLCQAGQGSEASWREFEALVQPLLFSF